MNKFDRHKNSILLILISLITLIGYLWLIKQSFFENFVMWSQDYFVLYFGVLVIVKVLAIVWPPIPGGVFTLGSIPVIGWKYAALADSLGGLIGSSMAYFIGKKYGFPILYKLFDVNAVEKVKKVSIVKGREFESVFVLRTIYNTVSEVVSFGSGLIGITYKTFFFASLLSYLLNFPLFYFVGGALTEQSALVNGVMLLVAILLFIKLRGRYFE